MAKREPDVEPGERVIRIVAARIHPPKAPGVKSVRPSRPAPPRPSRPAPARKAAPAKAARPKAVRPKATRPEGRRGGGPGGYPLGASFAFPRAVPPMSVGKRAGPAVRIGSAPELAARPLLAAPEVTIGARRGAASAARPALGGSRGRRAPSPTVRGEAADARAMAMEIRRRAEEG